MYNFDYEYAWKIPKDHIDLKDSWPTMANSLYKMHLQGIMLVVFMKTNI